MGKVPIPKGWKRLKVGNRIVYESDPPRVKIYKTSVFDKLKANGRFGNVQREQLNFSLKFENETDNGASEQDLPESEPMEITMPTIFPPVNDLLQSQPPFSQPPVSQPPVSQPLVNQPPVSQPAVSQPAVSQPTVSQPPVGQLPENQPHAGSRDTQKLNRAALHKSLVDTSVQLLTKDTSSTLDHRKKLKEAASKLNNLRTASENTEISFEQLKQAVNECDSAR